MAKLYYQIVKRAHLVRSWYLSGNNNINNNGIMKHQLVTVGPLPATTITEEEDECNVNNEDDNEKLTNSNLSITSSSLSSSPTTTATLYQTLMNNLKIF